MPSSAQDVAEAARQERARKEAEQKKPKHVYTEDDLKRAQILTPEDRAALDAKRNEELSDKDKTEEALDHLPLGPNVGGSGLSPEDFLSPLPPDAPLGDVARYYRRWKISQALRREQEFPLTLPKAPVLASPKSMQPLQPLVPTKEPSAPHFDAPQRLMQPARPSRTVAKPVPPEITPFQPPVKRSPFARPKLFTAEPPRMSSSRPVPPSLATQPPAEPAKPRALGKPSRPVVTPAPSKTTHVNPPAIAGPLNPTKPLAAAPEEPRKPLGFANSPKPLKQRKATKPMARVNPPTIAAPLEPEKPFGAEAPAEPVRPPRTFAAGDSKPVAPAKPSKPQARLNAPAIAAQVDPAKPLASAIPTAPVEPRKQLGIESPSKPLVPVKPVESPVQVNPPALVAPMHPAKPLASAAPAAPVARGVAPKSTAPVQPAELRVVTVKSGDSLWKLAQVNLGDGLRWHEVLAVNPDIHDANHIEAGSKILLPAAAASAGTSKTMILQRGDTLSKIAREKFGHGSSWPCIAQANPTLKDPNVIYAGKKLVLPDDCKK